MVTVHFAPHLQRHVACAPQQLVAETLAEALTLAFAAAPAMRAYVLDEQGHIRKHVAVFVNGQLHHRRQDLSLVLSPDADIFVFQALSGG
ncbi:MAG: hypothetical protein RLZZ502_309 [Pseudomonadota bacterium]|jgi:sulfur carrier protein ThiS